MKSKFIAALMTLLLVTSAAPIQARAAAQFSDVDTHWAKKEILYLSDRNIIGGYPDGTFKPNQPITRVQAASMLAKALKLSLSEDTSTEFKDVAKTSPHYQVLATMNELGILRGDNGYIRPGEKTSRAQMAAILRRSFNMPLDKQATFIDVTPAHWAYQDINGIAKQRVAGGSKGKYMPADYVTRAQFSAFLVRALDDSQKLSAYHSYVGVKGKTVEQNGFSYTIAKEGYNSKLFKENLKTGKREAIVIPENIPSDDTFQVHLLKGFQLIVYNDEIFIPYWSAVGEMSELPIAYGLMKVKTDGQNLVLMNQPYGYTFRNMFIWNDRIYYTNEKNKERYFDYTFNPDKPVIDDPLVLYSTAMDGSDKKKEYGFDARVIFDNVAFTPNHVQVNQNNKSVLFDHSTMYYFNKKGVYKYSLLDKKTSKLSNVIGEDMRVTETQLIVTDTKGKTHTLKK
ncbi:S-layer homology domain-containing protein [Sporosarcina aquimarina]|uniref:S-layer homology domain-containing protein n=1 Tax=Sporosarcina aquimarina TaxID=114975 RepID=UPI001C8D1DC8|nr:S-layer homology domain-containing protein [Sporosarcina aquimarina]MBY0221838.1 S-layer homology domain-containing protein [Sporosarcina aquimarina]